MMAPEKVSLSDFVSRRLNPTKVTLAFLRHELAARGNGASVAIDRHELASVIATLEIFIEDYEKLVTREPRPAVPLPAMASLAGNDRSAGYVADARA